MNKIHGKIYYIDGKEVVVPIGKVVIHFGDGYHIAPLGSYATKHEFVDQPERLSEKTPKGDAIV